MEETYDQMLALLEELLDSGEQGPEALCSWYLDNVGKIEAVVDNAAPLNILWEIQ